MATRHIDTRPSPVAAAALSTFDVHVESLANHCSGDVLKHKVCDRETIRRLAIHAVVGLSHNYAELGAVSDLDIAVGNAIDNASLIRSGFLSGLLALKFSLGAKDIFWKRPPETQS